MAQREGEAAPCDTRRVEHLLLSAVQLVQQAKKRVMTALCLNDCHPVQCDELPSEALDASAHNADEPRSQPYDDGVFTVRVLSPTPAAESGRSASLNHTQDADGGTADDVLKPATTTQRQCTTRLNRVVALKQIAADLEGETRAINDGVNFPTTPSFRSAMAMVRMPIYMISL